MSDLIEALNELRAAQPEYERAEDYYEGDAEERFSNALIRQLLRGDDSDFRVNLACRPVDAVLDRLMIAAITGPDDAITHAINQIWHDNELDIEAPQIHENTLKYGDAYLFVWPSESDTADADTQADDTEGDGGTLDPKLPGVDMFYNSPMVARILYDPEHPRRKRLAIKAWCITDAEGNELTRVNLYYADHLEKHISKPRTPADKDEHFEPYIDDDTDENGHIPNPYGQVPFFHFRTRRPYGRPEHKNAYGPQDALTKLIKNQMSTSDFSAFPQRYASLIAGADSDDDQDWGYDDTTDPESRLSSLTSSPGSLWVLRNIDKIGEFTAADVENFLKPMGIYMRFMASTTTTPMRWFDPSGQIPSGESVRADDAPLVKKINARQRSLTSTWREAGAFALEILGIHDAVINVRWAPPQIQDDLEFWQTVIAKQQAGIPVRQTLLEAGYTETECDSWGYTENDPDGPVNLQELMAPTRQTKAGK